MSRLIKVLVQLGLAIVVLLSFGAAGSDLGVNDDGDENLGIAVVLAEARKTPAHEEAARNIRTASLRSPVRGGSAEAFASQLHTESPLPMLGSPHLMVPLRT